MKTIANKFQEIKNRRRFLTCTGKTFIGLLLSGIPFDSLAFEKPTNDQIEKYVFDKFERLYKANYVPRLLEDVKIISPPLKYDQTKNLIFRDYLLRWDISHTFSDLSEEKLIGLLEREDSSRFVLWDQKNIKYEDRINLITTFQDKEIPISPKPFDIKPIETMEISLDDKLKNKSYCKEIILKIILEAVTGVKFTQEIIETLKFDLKDTIECIFKALYEMNWNKFESCLIRFSIQIFSTKYMKKIEKAIGPIAFKKLLRNTATRFVPIVGTAFFLFQITMAVKGNWNTLKEYCLDKS